MKRKRVTSESIAEIGYDPSTSTLEVLFTSGRIYHYLKVPEDVYDGLMSADSHGKHLNATIKPRYQYVPA